jgi:chemotaxis signal transduction protein
VISINNVIGFGTEKIRKIRLFKCERFLSDYCIAEDVMVGLVVEVLGIPENTIEPPPSIVGGVESDYIKGVGKLENRLLILLELKKLFTSTDRKDIESFEMN